MADLDFTRTSPVDFGKITNTTEVSTTGTTSLKPFLDKTRFRLIVSNHFGRLCEEVIIDEEKD